MIRFKSLRSRLIFYFSLVILITLLISTFVATSLVRDYVRQTAIEELNRQADIVANISAEESLLPSQFIRTTEKILQKRILFIRSPGLRGRPLPQHEKDQFIQDKLAQEIIDWELMEDDERQIITSSEIPGTDTRAVMVAEPIFFRGTLAGAVIMAQPLRVSQQLILPLVIRMVVAGSVALTISLMLAFWFSKYFTDPLSKITASAEEIAKGDFDQRVDIESEDEIGRLAKTFNYMTEKVGESIRLRANFLMNVSHELRTPLTSIQGFSEALIDKTVEKEEEKETTLKVINDESKHLSRLIDDLLDLAKLDAKQFSLHTHEFDINELLTDLGDKYDKRCKDRSIKFTIKTSPLPPILSDSTRVNQIVTNIIENALKFTPASGRVDLKSTIENDTITIAVSNSGPGIKSGDLTNIFKPFYSSGSKKGSGLGLAIASELSRALGGDIEVMSKPGELTTFKVFLPIRYASKG